MGVWRKRSPYRSAGSNRPTGLPRALRTVHSQAFMIGVAYVSRSERGASFAVPEVGLQSQTSPRRRTELTWISVYCRLQPDKAYAFRLRRSRRGEKHEGSVEADATIAQPK